MLLDAVVRRGVFDRRARVLLLAPCVAACAGGDAARPVTPDGGATGSPHVARVVLTPTAGPLGLDTLVVGDTVQLSAVAYGADGTVLSPTITWASDAPGVGAVLPAVGGTARVIVSGAGAATITATADGQRAGAILRATADAPTALCVVGAPVILVGQRRVITVAAIGRRHRPVPILGVTAAPDDSTRVGIGVVTVGAPTTVQVLGRTAGTTTVRLSAGSATASLLVEVVVPALQVDVVEVDALPARVRGALTAAIQRWQTVFVSYGSLVTITSPAGIAICGQNTPVGTTESVVGLRLYVRVQDSLAIAGAAAVSGRCIIRGTRTVVGAISIRRDYAATLDSAVIAGIMLHELGHVLGIGSWPAALTRDVPGADPHFLGAAAIQAFAAAGGKDALGVPLENTGIGPYTHWRQAAFGLEAMVAVSARDVPLSAVTIAALADLGYDVRLSAADPYRVPGAPAADVGSRAARAPSGAEGAMAPAGRIGRISRDRRRSGGVRTACSGHARPSSRRRAEHGLDRGDDTAAHARHAVRCVRRRAVERVPAQEDASAGPWILAAKRDRSPRGAGATACVAGQRRR